ncbi:RagB/SusD family nutrient uptake outer membrane protein [Rapidithrix thailandica]|uniref:RagB/SusD family nutrient uptake outer membrane protein n=1 Tax=Rapidithrix thailandica TaxID=413964 RepID=A0AAW9S413_9BACT
MIKIYKVHIMSLVVAGTMLLLTACDSQLDIKPRQLIKTEEVLVDEGNLQLVLISAYTGLKGTFGTNEAGELYGGDFNFFSELLASTGEVTWVGSFDQQKELINKAVLVNNSRVRDSWIRAYDVMNSLNIVLKYLDLAKSPESKASLEGQALALRGLIYFDLVRFWGTPYQASDSEYGVPLVLTPTEKVEDIEFVPRNTVHEVYGQVVEDLLKAKQLLEGFDKNDVFISSYAVSAILSRVYLQQGEFQKAAEEANRVIGFNVDGKNIYKLMDSPLKAFNNESNSTEDVFALQLNSVSTSGENNAGLTTHYARLNGHGRGDMRISQSHIDLYEDGDLRGGVVDNLADEAVIANVDQMFYIGVGGQNDGGIQTSKYGDGSRNISIIRLAEMYLTRAEANFEAGTNIGASPLEDINVIRERAGLDPLAGPLTREMIHKERHLELAWEGFTLHDMKRWKENIGSLAYDAPELILPIPEREIEANENLKQLPHYGQ